MPDPGAVKSLRYRYIIGLSAIAILATISHTLLTRITEAQRSNAHIVRMAAIQSGLTNRIAYFVSEMATTRSEDSFDVARAQLGRTIHKMLDSHETLLGNRPNSGLPILWNSNLEVIYYDASIGLDAVVRRYLQRARNIYDMPFGTNLSRSSSHVYVTSYGPHVLEPLLDSAVTEYERIGSEAIQSITLIENVIWVVTLSALMLEAILIFHPLEKRVRSKIEALSEAREKLASSLLKAEERRHEALAERDRARQADQAKDKFLSNMSHEFRTPLNAIIGFAESLDAGIYGPIEDAKQRDRIGIIGASGRHLLELVNDLLDVSALEAGRLTLIKTEVPIVDIISESVRFVEDSARHKQTQIEVEPFDADLRQLCDPRRIVQVVVNLISNAVKYSDAGSIVGISATTDGANGAMRISVADNGHGMTEEQIDIALTRFGQVSREHEVTQNGTGLGLPLARDLMQLHGGMLEIDSRVGVGTTVTLVFPLPSALGSLADAEASRRERQKRPA